MHIVAIHGWQEESPELIQSLAMALGITAYEMRQRLVGGGPSVAACFIDPLQAAAAAVKLQHSGVRTLTVDTDALRGAPPPCFVRRCEFADNCLRIAGNSGEAAQIPYNEIALLLPGLRIAGQSGSKTVTERKFSLGKTILSGGIPMTAKVQRQETTGSEERENLLYLYAADRPPVVFSQSSMSFDGFGPAMQLTRELNFAFLKNELRRRCPTAGHDDRLLSRLGQLRLLGPTINPETGLELAFHILSRTLLPQP